MGFKGLDNEVVEMIRAVNENRESNSNASQLHIKTENDEPKFSGQSCYVITQDLKYNFQFNN